jgi:hypothetical protein
MRKRFAAMTRLGVRRAAALAVACALAPQEALAQLPAPIPWQEQGPAGRLFLQLPLEAPEPLAVGALAAEARLLWSNTLVVGESDRARVDVDLETALTTLLVRAGLAPGLELSAALPVATDAGGVFDGFIEGVERAFNSENFQRAGRPRGLTRFVLGPAAGGGLAREGAATGLGDAWAGLKWLARGEDGARPALALRAALKAPTGASTFGSGTWDAAAGLLAAWSWPRAALRLSLDGAVPGGRLAAAGLPTRPYGAAQAGLAYRLAGWLTGHVQVSAHLSPLDGTGVPQLDKPIYDAAFGVSAALGRRVELVLAGVENFASPRRGADAAFLVALRLVPPGPGDGATAAQQPGVGPASSVSLAAPSRGR